MRCRSRTGLQSSHTGHGFMFDGANRLGNGLIKALDWVTRKCAPLVG